MKREVEYKITLDDAKRLARVYCEQNGYSFEKLMECETYYEAPKPSGDDCWLFGKPYEGSLVDENGNIMDLQTLPKYVMAVSHTGTIQELDHIDLIKP